MKEFISVSHSSPKIMAWLESARKFSFLKLDQLINLSALAYVLINFKSLNEIPGNKGEGRWAGVSPKRREEVGFKSFLALMKSNSRSSFSRTQKKSISHRRVKERNR